MSATLLQTPNQEVSEYGFEKATKNAQTLFFQADEGHEKATEKPRVKTSQVTKSLLKFSLVLQCIF